jgi:hypothetical protein
MLVGGNLIYSKPAPSFKKDELLATPNPHGQLGSDTNEGTAPTEGVGTGKIRTAS